MPDVTARPNRARRPYLIERMEWLEQAAILITAALGEGSRLPEPHRSTLKAIIEAIKGENGPAKPEGQR